MVEKAEKSSDKSAAAENKDILPFDEVHIQPTVLLSCADHHRRIQDQMQNTSNRVIGALLGKIDGETRTLNITNSFAIPYDEEIGTKNNALFIESEYVTTIYAMLLRVNMNEKIVGWYHTGTGMRLNDKEISSYFMKYTNYPIVAKINLSPEAHKMPLETYTLVQKSTDDESLPSSIFKGVSCKIVAEESEQVGIEQLLRCIKNNSVSDLASHIDQKMLGIQQFQEHINQMGSYLEKAANGTIKPNNEIIANIQKIWYSIPELHFGEHKAHQITSSINDNFLMLYIASLVRSTLGIHSLIENKLFIKETIEKTSVRK